MSSPIVRKQSLDPIDFDGLTILDYTAQLDLPSSLAVIDVPAGASHAESWSTRSGKYYLVIDGSIRFTLDGDTIDLDAGDFVYVEKGRHFSYSNDSAEPARLVLMHTPAFELDAERFEPDASA